MIVAGKFRPYQLLFPFFSAYLVANVSAMGDDWKVKAFSYTMYAMIVGWAWHIDMGIAADKRNEKIIKSIQADEPLPESVILARHTNLPPVHTFAQGNTLFNQVISLPKIDKEIMLAKTLNNMRIGGFKMDISESYWIRDNHWSDSPETFRATRGKWEHYQIVGKRGNSSNSRYEVMNERAVELIAQGRIKLPPPPEL